MKIVYIHKSMHFYNTVSQATLVAARFKKIRLVNVIIKDIQNVKRAFHETKHLSIHSVDYVAINSILKFIYLEL